MDNRVGERLVSYSFGQDIGVLGMPWSGGGGETRKSRRNEEPLRQKERTPSA